MQSILIDLLFCAFLYAILIAFIFVRESKKKNNRDTDSGDDEGGLPVVLPPDIDLPPGVCLPDDRPRIKNTEPEEVFA